MLDKSELPHNVTDPVHRLRFATQFRTIIYQRANRSFFLEQASHARDNLNRYWRLAWGDKTFPVDTQNEHKQILDLCVARDRDGLMKFVEQHIMSSGKVVLCYLQRIEAGEFRTGGTGFERVY